MSRTIEELNSSQLLELVRELQAEVAKLRAENESLREENQQLRDRIADLEKKNPTPRVDEPYSVDAEEKRRQKKARQKKRQQKSKRRGRKTTEEKVDLAEQCEIVHPAEFDLEQCHFVRERVVWRIQDGRAVRVVYELWHGPGNEKPTLPGVFPRSEFGIEIHVTVAFLVCMVGLSMDKVVSLLRFFWRLELSKSQVDALLNQLSRRWQGEFETLCDLLAHSAVVHADETSWSVRSVWAFLSEQARVMVFGCRKDAATLAQILPKESFEGVLVSDNAAVYQGFTQAQKCWAHLLRKAIKLTLLHPENDEYRTFLDGLLKVYYQAKRFAADGRLGESGRAARVNDLDNLLAELLAKYCDDEAKQPLDTFAKDFQNLVHELIRLMSEGELFTFVLYPDATGTNNEAERSLRGAALDRRTGRTSKTARGARRRSILASVFESLKLHLKSMTLDRVVAEILSWQNAGESLFERLHQAAGLPPPDSKRLETIVPNLEVT